ncbi:MULTISPECIES: hypothetical protein [unclassified Serratia (in: enterobacteria)]|uniref:hypothetical protein n=1 Tax=unclassified Serratia (in: enterobacteria) TaxID=2647522 RepID=UPI000506F570|nr:MULTISPECIES: hypothetical protein [unclassified Serratia (in: enterobacteria)]KFK92068.1 hypothetical protein JV45_22655 [Serratia sp. Ag2]KFK96190.1 hypothetical protein IV04_19300 [Serratia sp. Ag1]
MKTKIFSVLACASGLLGMTGAQAVVNISNCLVTEIGNGIWEGSFNFVADNFPTTQTLNIIYVGIPIPVNGFIGGQTMPTVTPSPLQVADFTLALTLGNAQVIKQSDGGIAIVPPFGSVLRNVTGSVKVRFDMSNPLIYPALRIDTRFVSPDQTISGWYFAVPGRTTGCLAGSSTAIAPPREDLINSDPKFTLKTAQWILGTADVGDLPDVSVAGNGYAATINAVASNNLCVNYLTDKVKANSYALSVSNSYSSQGGRNLFALNGSNGSQLLYNLQLVSNDGVTGNNFNFPATAANYITLSQLPSSVDKRSEMCWTPKINLFKNATTQAGMHTDTLNFMITPKA